MDRNLSPYEIPAQMVTYLIGETINGHRKRRVAARMLLDCLRRKVDVPACLS